MSDDFIYDYLQRPPKYTAGYYDIVSEPLRVPSYGNEPPYNGGVDDISFSDLDDFHSSTSTSSSADEIIGGDDSGVADTPVPNIVTVIGAYNRRRGNRTTGRGGRRKVVVDERVRHGPKSATTVDPRLTAMFAANAPRKGGDNELAADAAGTDHVASDSTGVADASAGNDLSAFLD